MPNYKQDCQLLGRDFGIGLGDVMADNFKI
jgi:hypothetical protein